MGLRARIADLRNRLLANRRFRARAARIWPFRLIARRRARQLFDLSAGFVYSQVLMTCIDVGWFDALAGGARPIGALADAARCSSSPSETAARASRSAARRSSDAASHYALGPLGAALIGDDGIAAMARHHAMLYADMARPLALLRGDAAQSALAGFWGYAVSEDPAALEADRVRAYSALMADSQPMIAEQVLAAYRFDRHRHLLDVGGGTGAFLAAVHARYPQLRRTLFDLPGVVANVDTSAPDAPEAVGGSFRADALPTGADVVSLVRIVHDHDDDVVLGLLARVRAALPADGTLIIAEPMAGTPGAEPIGDAYFGFYLLAMGSGRARSKAEIDALLAASGFAPGRWHPTPIPLICSVISTYPI